MERASLNLELLERANQPIPRYTSYPTAVEWRPLSSATYGESLASCGAEGKPLSLYLHIPFCKRICLYCACSVVLNRRRDRESAYVNALLQEIHLVRKALGGRLPLRQLHFGGGTPTQLSIEELSRIMVQLQEAFDLDREGEIAIEIDPRTVWEEGSGKLEALRNMGFNRVSFGVQDTDPRVQRAVRRDQSEEMTCQTFHEAVALGFQEINVDLIYGLPHQTVTSFTHTCEVITALQPARIALYSYAKVPFLKPHQRAIREETLPQMEEKFAIYLAAREHFLAQGYHALGMDHFALPHSTLATALEEKRLQRNFQGYTVRYAEHLLGLGMTATGFVQGGYFQNVKSLEEYQQKMQEGELATLRGHLLTEDDKRRHWVIQRLMCDLRLDKKEFASQFGCDFDITFSAEAKALAQLEKDGLLLQEGDTLLPTELGKTLIRNIACSFDWYLRQPTQQRRFSYAI